jgi:hypothetical protein
MIPPTLVHLIGMGKDLSHVLDSTAQLQVLSLQQQPIVSLGSDREPYRSCYLEEIVNTLAHIASLHHSSVSLGGESYHSVARPASFHPLSP